VNIIADTSRCQGHGLCEALAPHLFQVGDDGVVTVLGVSTETDADAVRLAVASCPVEALSVAE
jgi:ferredoxin